MKRVFVDTNVLLDFLLNREDFSEDAETILSAGFNKKYLLYASSLKYCLYSEEEISRWLDIFRT